MAIIKKQAVWMSVCLAVGAVFIISGIYTSNISVMSMGVGLVVISSLKLINLYRTTKDPVKMKKYMMLQSEERLISIAEKSGRLALVISLLIEILLSVYFSVIGNSSLGLMLCYLAGGQTLIYLICYCYFSRRI